jgi:large conductance mechanosensitive channel
MVAEFKEFIARGNVVDLAVGVVIGAAFGRIVSALVDGVIMPVVGVALGGASVSDWAYVLRPETVDASGARVAAVAIAYGALLQAALDFLLVALVIFLLLRAYNRLRKPVAAAAVAPAEEVVLLREIRDALRGRGMP